MKHEFSSSCTFYRADVFGRADRGFPRSSLGYYDYHDVGSAAEHGGAVDVYLDEHWAMPESVARTAASTLRE